LVLAKPQAAVPAAAAAGELLFEFGRAADHSHSRCDFSIHGEYVV
jgi:hypothetical protein